MKLPMYSVRDVKTTFWFPQVEQNEDSAIRDFAMMINNNGITGFAPKDFDFYRVGSFDTEKGVIIPEKTPYFVCSGTSVFGMNNEK